MKFLILALLTIFLTTPADAEQKQPQKKTTTIQKKSSSKKSKPVFEKEEKNQEVILTSEGGVEWNSNAKTMTAYDNAIVVRGDMALRANKIVAYYTEDEKKKTTIKRAKAFGNVIITTKEQVAYSDTADYDIPNSVIILKGNPVKMIAGDDEMTAKVVELWQTKDVAIARNKVVAKKDARVLEAEVVRAFFKNDAKKGGKKEIEHFEAEENVVITTEKEKIEGNFGKYYPDKQEAYLEGDVKLSQGNSYIRGELATINMKTGISHLQTPSKNSKANKRQQVFGSFVPSEIKKDHKKEEKVKEQPVVPEKVETKEPTNEQEGKFLGTIE